MTWLALARIDAASAAPIASLLSHEGVVAAGRVDRVTRRSSDRPSATAWLSQPTEFLKTGVVGLHLDAVAAVF